jgi:ribosomal protein L3
VLLQLKDAAKVAEYQPGQQLEITEMFKEGDNIDIAGTTVGKGFQGEQQTPGQQQSACLQYRPDST